VRGLINLWNFLSIFAFFIFQTINISKRLNIRGLMHEIKWLNKKKEELAHEKLSPFLETQMGQLIAEIPHTRSGYELLVRIKNQLVRACVKSYVPKKRPSKGRRRSAKELAKNAEWYNANRREVRDELRRSQDPSEPVSLMEE
jgi:hypothetical protein